QKKKISKWRRLFTFPFRSRKKAPPKLEPVKESTDEYNHKEYDSRSGFTDPNTYDDFSLRDSSRKTQESYANNNIAVEPLYLDRTASAAFTAEDSFESSVNFLPERTESEQNGSFSKRKQNSSSDCYNPVPQRRSLSENPNKSFQRVKSQPSDNTFDSYENKVSNTYDSEKNVNRPQGNSTTNSHSLARTPEPRRDRTSANRNQTSNNRQSTERSFESSENVISNLQGPRESKYNSRWEHVESATEFDNSVRTPEPKDRTPVRRNQNSERQRRSESILRDVPSQQTLLSDHGSDQEADDDTYTPKPTPCPRVRKRTRTPNKKEIMPLVTPVAVNSKVLGVPRVHYLVV
uniref:Uncharacterized protein n=1 Tax=Ciona savignyi TaxID=51511 RepID=H2ZIP7_CIOSA